jgi:hypothetical protein
MTIWERVRAALTPLATPMASGTFITATPDDLPDLYLVYFLVSSPAEQHMDNVETLRSNRMQISVYSRNGLAGLPDVSGAMVSAGFMAGPKTELPYNQQTRHFGLALEYVDIEEV